MTLQAMKPTPKMAAAGIGGSFALIAVWVAGMVGVPMPAEVGTALGAVLSWVFGYMKRERN